MAHEVLEIWITIVAIFAAVSDGRHVIAVTITEVRAATILVYAIVWGVVGPGVNPGVSVVAVERRDRPPWGARGARAFALRAISGVPIAVGIKAELEGDGFPRVVVAVIASDLYRRVTVSVEVVQIRT
jgi:hypothetical protein